MFGLSEHIRREVTRVGVGGDDQDFGRAGDEVDSDIARQQALRCRHIDVAGADNAIGARYSLRAVGERRDGLRAAHSKYLAQAEPMRDAIDFVYRLRAGDADVRHSCDLRRDSRHNQRGRERITAGGNVGTDCIERPNDLAEFVAASEVAARFARELLFRVAANIG